jgi:hypothetical protein
VETAFQLAQVLRGHLLRDPRHLAAKFRKNPDRAIPLLVEEIQSGRGSGGE